MGSLRELEERKHEGAKYALQVRRLSQVRVSAPRGRRETQREEDCYGSVVVVYVVN